MEGKNISDQILQLNDTAGGRTINMQCRAVGADYQVLVSGGVAHIGAVAVGVCYDKTRGKSNTSVIAVYGHKEEEVARMVAGRLSKALRTNVAVSAGIHFDGLTMGDIKRILTQVEQLVDQLINRLSAA